MRTVYRRSIMCLSAGVCILLGLGLLIHPDGGANVSAEAPGVAAAAGDRKPGTARVQLPEAVVSVNVPGASTEDSTPTDAAITEFEMDLPSPFGEGQLDALLTKMERDRVYRAQDAAMATWPKYAEVREIQYQELASGLDLEHLSAAHLVPLALKLRDAFWTGGGNFSGSAYVQGYKARILLELAHEKKPEDTKTTDELAETIQAPWVWWKFRGDTRIRTADNVKDLLDLRLEQCQRISKEIENGRTPTWDDFVRANDLTWLLHRAEQHRPPLFGPGLWRGPLASCL